MTVLWSVNLLLFMATEIAYTPDMISGSHEFASLTVEVCMKSSWSLEVRWNEHPDNISTVQTYEVQIKRSENLNIIAERSVRKEAGIQSVSLVWTSELPLQCADHFIRIRRIAGLWTDWTAHYGQQNNSSKILRVFPSEEVLREESAIFCCCIPPDGARVTALYFANTPYPLINISHQVRAIRVLSLNTTKIGVNLICQDDLGTEKVVLNYVTFPPEKPENLSCETRNRKNVVCSWTRGREPNLSGARRRQYTLHILNTNGVIFPCDKSPSSCEFPVVPDLIFYNISVVVRNSLGEERESYAFNITDRVFPVLEDLAVIPGVLDAEVFWTLDGNFTGLKLLCQITIEPITTTTELQCVGADCVGTLNVCVQHLQPNSQYFTKGRCAVQHNSWSSWSTTHTFRTEPLITLDVWRKVTEHQHDRSLWVLWKTFDNKSRTTIRTYEVCVQQQEHRCVNVTQQQINFTVRNEACYVSVRAITHTGLSLPSSIIVPVQNTDSTVKEKRIVGNAEGFLLTWSKLSSATCGYILEWCMMGSLKPCHLQWKKVSVNQTSLLLRAKEQRMVCRYTFNIYTCQSDGHYIQERHIGYLKERPPLQAPDIQLSSRVSSHSITLEWIFDEESPNHPGFITGYTLTLHREPDDRHGVLSLRVNDPHCKSETVEGLRESQCYTLHLAACTKAGCGTKSVFTFTTLPQYYMLVLKIVTPLLLLIGCCYCLWSYRNIVRGIVVDVFIFPKHHNMKMMELDDDIYNVSKEIGALAVEECESCDVEIVEQEIHTHLFYHPDSDHKALTTVTNLTYLLLSNEPQHEKHCGSSSSDYIIPTSPY